MPSIQIGPEFFRNEARNYSNVSLCIAREAIQNAVDAGARQIDVSIESHCDSMILYVADDGCGMTRNVLEDVFFCLGRTTKGGDSNVGGFGKARVLLAFAQRSYEIRTRDMQVMGSGADYQIQEGLPHVRGCQFRIDVATDELGISSRELLQAFQRYLGMSQLSARVRLNDVDWTNWTYRRQAKRHLSFGSVHVNKAGAHQHRVLVRVNGLLMFARYTAFPGQVIVEIDPARSRDVLLSNRDGLRADYAAELDEFIQEISTDTISAFCDKNQAETHVLAGSPRMFVPKSAVSAQTLSLATLTNLAVARLAYASEPSALESVSSDHRDPVLDGIVIVSKAQDPRLKRAARLFHPRSWGGVHGGKRKQLLLQWIIACEAALESYCKVRGAEGLAWRPGFVIDPEMRACHIEQEDGSHALLLNPVECQVPDLVGTIAYKLRDYDSHARLLTLAAHEVSHCAADCRQHGEAFSSLFTDIMAGCAGKLPEVHRQMMEVS